jgi:small subunit ribosomal protein S6
LKRYEGMFLFDNSIAHEWPAIETEVRRLCDRIGAELQVCLKFDERKLFYEIKRRKRGTYVLTYFNADPMKIGELERDAQLSEAILRVLVLRNPTVTDQQVAELKARPADMPLQPVSGDLRRGDDEGRDGYRGRGGWGRDRDRGPRDHGRDGDRRPRESEGGPGGGDEVPSEATVDV